MDGKQNDWNPLLDPLMMGYKSVVHRTLGEAPFDMMFGRPCRLPLDTLVGPPLEIEYEVMHPLEYLQNLADGMKAAHDTVSAYIGRAYSYQKKVYDRHIKPQKFAVGQVVWL